MRKMYSENQVKAIVKQGISSGEIKGGSKLYKYHIVYNDGNEIYINSTLKLNKIDSFGDIYNLWDKSNQGYVISALEQNGIITDISNETSSIFYVDTTLGVTKIDLSQASINSWDYEEL